MKNLVCYKTLPIWDVNTLPTLFREKHNTQIGTWAKLNIIKGYVNFDMLTEQGWVRWLSNYSNWKSFRFRVWFWS